MRPTDSVAIPIVAGHVVDPRANQAREGVPGTRSGFSSRALPFAPDGQLLYLHRYRFCVSVQPRLLRTEVGIHVVAGGLVALVYQRLNGGDAVVVDQAGRKAMGAAGGDGGRRDHARSSPHPHDHAGSMAVALRASTPGRLLHGDRDHEHVGIAL